MIARPLPIALVAAVLLTGTAAGCGDDEDDGGTETGGAAATATTATGGLEEIAGDWTGELRQKGIAPFEVAVRIDPEGTTRVAYTGIDCGGEWTFDEVLLSDPARYLVTETIDEGAGGECKGTGRVTLVGSGGADGPALAYTFTGGGVTSRGTLRPTDAAGVERVFERAGVRPPG